MDSWGNANTTLKTMPTIDDWNALRVMIGTVLRAEPNTGARDAAVKLWIDLGGAEPVQSSAKITDQVDQLIGRQVVVVAGFEPVRVGGFRSDVLVLGGITSEGVVLLAPDEAVPPGSPVA